MKPTTVTSILFLALAANVHAIPQDFIGVNFFGPVIPAQPAFGANLTKDFLDKDNWDNNEFPGPWQDAPALAGESVRTMKEMPVLFGAVPMSVHAYAREGRLEEISITYLEAGAFFGFNLGGEKTDEEKVTGAARRAEFEKHYKKLERDLRDRLKGGCGRSRETNVGRSKMLRTTFSDYKWEDFVLRFAARDGHSISLHLSRGEDLPDSFLDPAAESLSRREREKAFKNNVHSTKRGDLLIGGLPAYQQGNTPFCGIHSLGMAAHYLGLRMHTEGLEASADFKNTGSAKGSKMVDVYRAVGEELRMRVSLTSKFDFDRARRSIEDGLPVIVWRRVTQEREAAHSMNAIRLASDPLADLPVSTESERERWPKRNYSHPSHASIVNGVNVERGEVIFTEPWGKQARNRRMRTEEMDTSVYAVFYFSP